MKRKALVLLGVVGVFVCSFVREAVPQNVGKKVPLEVFIHSVMGKTRVDIISEFGKPSCEGPAGMIYENFVKDKTGGIGTVVVTFDQGFPVGTVKIRDGKRVAGLDDIRWIASKVVCPHGTYSIEPSGDPLIQNYNLYFKAVPGGWGVVENSLLSCSGELQKGFTGWVDGQAPKSERDRAVREVEERRRDETERVEARKQEKAPLESTLEKLIGKQISIAFQGIPYKGISFEGGCYTSVSPDWKGESFVTKEGQKYVLARDEKRENGKYYKCYLIEDKHKDGVDYIIFECLIFPDKKRVGMTIWVYKEGQEHPSGNRKVSVPRYSSSPVEYADGSPIDLIASKLLAQVK